MTDQPLVVRDANRVQRAVRHKLHGDKTLTPYNIEDPDQRAELLALLEELTAGIVLAGGANLIGKVAPSSDQDPIFNEAAGVKVALAANTSTDIIIPPAGCKFVLVSVTADTVFATDNPVNVADDGKSVMVFAGTERMLPVTPTVKVKAISTSASTVRAMPMKERA